MPNQAIALYEEVEMMLIQLENIYSGDGSIEFRWAPNPGYYFTFRMAESNSNPHRGMAKLVTLDGNEYPIEIRWTEKNGGFLYEGPLRTQVLYGDLNKKINNISFFISNFYINPLTPFILKYKEWEVLLMPVDNIQRLFENLDKNGGYAFTYLGHVRYKGGSSFAVTEVEYILEPLRVFLSFVRGSWCNLFFFEGTANEKPVVAIHPNPLLGPIIPLSRWPRQPEHLIWCNNHIQKDLHVAFSRFMELYEEGQLSPAGKYVDAYNHIRQIIINYIESGLMNYGETSIVIIQSALESLAYMQAQRLLGRICLESFKKSNAETKIRWMLNKLNIHTDIPPEAKDLYDYLKGKGLSEPLDGPKGLTYLRNGIIHGNPKLITRPLGTPTDTVPSEISMEYIILLGRMYLELSILSVLDYHGNYTNRLNGSTSQVPLKVMALSQIVHRSPPY